MPEPTSPVGKSRRSQRSSKRISTTLTVSMSFCGSVDRLWWRHFIKPSLCGGPVEYRPAGQNVAAIRNICRSIEQGFSCSSTYISGRPARNRRCRGIQETPRITGSDDRLEQRSTGWLRAQIRKVSFCEYCWFNPIYPRRSAFGRWRCRSHCTWKWWRP